MLELGRLFSENNVVQRESWGTASERAENPLWTVEFHYLTENQVRAVARIYREALKK